MTYNKTDTTNSLANTSRKANENKDPYDIYDRMFKRILTLSKKSVIRFINGTFDKNFSDESNIIYNWTEFEDDNLKKTLADTIITINGAESFHIEAQMYDDDNIMIRMIDYGYKHALRTLDFIDLPLGEKDMIRLNFPKQIIIYLNTSKSPDEYKVCFNFDDQGEMLYKIPVIHFQEEEIPEIKEKNMVILLPFKLLLLRDKIEASRSQENISRLRELFEDDIISTVEASYDAGNITREDMIILKLLTRRLFKHLYSNFDELKEILKMHDQSLELEIDKYIDALDEKNEIIKEKDALIDEKDALIDEKDATIKKLQAELSMLRLQNS